MRAIAILILCLSALASSGQEKSTVNYGSLTGAFGEREGSGSVEFFHNWKLGKSGKFMVGLGGRLTTYFGSDHYFSSAPASLASDDTKSDSLLLSSSNIFAINAAINLAYRITDKFDVGFDIDAAGFSFGGKQDGFYLNGSAGQATSASPTSFNVLLIGNNDRGTLNSEFYVRYFFKENWGIKLAYQYLFTEYTTSTVVQQLPEANDRFRHKAQMVSIGITKVF